MEPQTVFRGQTDWGSRWTDQFATCQQANLSLEAAPPLLVSYPETEEIDRSLSSSNVVKYDRKRNVMVWSLLTSH